MCGLKEAAILAYEKLREHLVKSGYLPMKQTPGLWRHEIRPTTFTLSVDDFGIKYFKKSDADHLFQALGEKYSLTVDWTGSNYLRLTLDWNYDAGYVEISMPDYVPKALKNSTTVLRNAHSMLLTPGLLQSTVKNSSMQPRINRNLWIKKEPNAFRRLLAHFYIKPEPWIPKFSLP